MAEHRLDDKNAEEKSMQQSKKGSKFKLPFIAVCLILGGIIVVMAVRIHNQNRLIAVQSEELEQKTQEIGIQSIEIAKKDGQAYVQSLRENCISGAEKALSLLRRGDRIGALNTAFSVFPGEGHGEMPYTPQAAYALSESMHLYGNGSSVVPNLRLETDGNIRFMKMSTDGSRILAVDESGEYGGTLYVWLTESGMLIDKFSVSEFSIKKGTDYFAFIDDTRFIYPTSEYKRSVYDTQKHEIAYELAMPTKGVGQVTADGTGSRFVLWMYNACSMIDTKTGEVLHDMDAESLYFHYTYNGNDVHYLSNGNFTFCGDDMYAVAVSKPQKAVKIYDADDGTLLHTYSVSGGSGIISSLYYAGGILYLKEYDDQEYDELYDMVGIDILSAIDIESGKTLWTYRSDKTRGFPDVVVSENDDYPYLVMVGYDEAVILDRTDGSFQEKYTFDNDIKAYGNSITDDTFLAITNDDVWHYVEFWHGSWWWAHRTEENFVYDTRRGFDDVIVQDGCVAALHNGTGYDSISKRVAVTLYSPDLGNGLETFLESNTRNLYVSGVVDPSGRYLAVQRRKWYVDLEVYDTASGEMLWSYATEHKEFAGNEFLALSYYPKREALVLMTDRGIRLFDWASGEELDYYRYESVIEKGYMYGAYVGSDMEKNFIGTDDTGRYVFMKDSDRVIGYDLENGKVAYKIIMEEGGLVYANGMDFAISSDREYLAVTNVYTHSLQLYRLYDWQTVKYAADADEAPVCIAELGGVDAGSVSALFFGDRREEGLELYVMYSNGDMETYLIRENPADLQSDVTDIADVTNASDMTEAAEGSKETVYIVKIPVRTYQGLEERLTRLVNISGQDYTIATGGMGSGAYLLWTADDAGYGQIIAHVEGFMALDPAHNQLYLTDEYNTCIYRVPVYDEDMLAEEAESVLSAQGNG